MLERWFGARRGRTSAGRGVDEAPADPQPVAVESLSDRDSREVPHGVRVAAGWMWRLLLIGVFIYALGWVMGTFSAVTVPLLVAILLTAMLWPLVNLLARHKVPRALAAVLGILMVVVTVMGVFSLVGTQIAGQWRELTDQAVNSFNQLMDWVSNGPLQISNDQIGDWIDQAMEGIRNSRSTIAGYLAGAAGGVGSFFSGLALALFAVFYFLYEGRRISNTAAHLIPAGSRPRVMDAASQGWISLVAYVRAAVIVAAVDGFGAGLGAAILGSSMWLAIGAFTFVTAFVPLLGALVSGAVATAVVFVTLGWAKALVMLAIFVGVMQVEANVLQPFLLGKAVSIHPLAVLYGLAIGFIVAGILGGLFAVPILAFGNAFIRALSSDAEQPPRTDAMVA